MTVKNSLGAAAGTLVREWYRQWAGISREPTRREVEQAVRLIEDYGQEVAMELVPALVTIMKESWPGAVRFGSIVAYIGDAVRVLDQKNREATRRLRQDAANAVRDMPESFRKAIWVAVPEEMKKQVREVVAKNVPRTRNDAEALDRECERWLKQFLP